MNTVNYTYNIKNPKLNEFIINNKAYIMISNNKYFFIKTYKRNFNEILNNAIESEKIMKNIKHKNLINMINFTEYKNIVIFLYFNYNCIDLITIYEKNMINYLDLLESIKFKISQQLIDVVNFLHNYNICHRDIKLDNILLDNENILLCDYEYCIETNENGFNKNINLKYVGTDIYMAPEMINKENIINFKKVDIWNSGLVIFIIFTKGNLLLYNTFKEWNNHFNINIFDKYFKDHNKEEFDLLIQFFISSLNPAFMKRKLINLL